MSNPVSSLVRPSWPHFYIQLARQYAERSTCPRRSVGAILVNAEQRIIAAGYNGAPSGQPHCTDVGCQIEAGRCLRSVHAELNAILSALQSGAHVRGATLYCTCLPCLHCANVILQVGVKRVVYDEAPEHYELADQQYRKETEYVRCTW